MSGFVTLGSPRCPGAGAVELSVNWLRPRLHAPFKSKRARCAEASQSEEARSAEHCTAVLIDEEQAVTSLYDAALHVLSNPNVYEKARLSKLYASRWATRSISRIESSSGTPLPVARASEHSAGGNQPEIVGAKKVVKFIHGVVHAEGCAIDLMWDLVARFQTSELPVEFYDDWVRIASEEADHFESWAGRLYELTGREYGCLPVRDTLWQSAMDTKDDLLGRLVLVHSVHEARGLDVFMSAYSRLERAGDHKSMEILKKSHEEEITHVAAAVKWFTRLCGSTRPELAFHEAVRKYSHNGQLVPPFNKEARMEAEMDMVALARSMTKLEVTRHVAKVACIDLCARALLPA